ncbi:MAG: glutaredoxin domain-containing protein [Bacteroidales bacterium]|jgi:glutaredoxin-like YruB-family protein|nr:glutaredoxin domain-containing protein [Bacteroidales bacterium]MDP2236377.1 glutaredoxin domain-containing protein [Bacteroidales bacterium]
MATQNILSHSEMLDGLKKDSKNYILLYNSETEAGKCSLNNILTAAQKLDKVNVMTADVTKVRDIHSVYNINSSPSLLVFEGDRFINVIKGCNDPIYYISLFEESYFHPAMGDGQPKQKRVIVYSTPSCSWCSTLKRYLKSVNIHYTDIDVSRNQQAVEEMVRKSGQQGVPQMDIEGRIIVGFDKNKINLLLGIQSSNN